MISFGERCEMYHVFCCVPLKMRKSNVKCYPWEDMKPIKITFIGSNLLHINEHNKWTKSKEIWGHLFYKNIFHSSALTSTSVTCVWTSCSKRKIHIRFLKYILPWKKEYWKCLTHNSSCQHLNVDSSLSCYSFIILNTSLLNIFHPLKFIWILDLKILNAHEFCIVRLNFLAPFEDVSALVKHFPHFLNVVHIPTFHSL